MGCRVSCPCHVQAIKVRPLSSGPPLSACKTTAPIQRQEIKALKVQDCRMRGSGSFDTADGGSRLWVNGVEIKPDVMELDFDTLDLAKETLISTAEDMLSSYDSLTFLSIPAAVLHSFIESTCNLYDSSLPFHTFAHAVAVLQILYRVCKLNLGFSSVTTELERFCMFVAALGHDVNHIGLGNGFLVNTNHDFVKKYGDKAVLEKHHCAILMDTLAREENDLFGQLPLSQATAAKHFITNCILATDNAQHQTLLARSATLVSGFSKAKDSDRVLAASMLLHAADIANQAYNPNLSQKWAKRVVDEFRVQAEKEREANLPISPQCDIHSESDARKLQARFIASFAIPTWSFITTFFPYTEDYIDNLRENQQLWTRGVLSVSL